MGSAARIAADLAKTKPIQEAIDAYKHNRCPKCGGKVYRVGVDWTKRQKVYQAGVDLTKCQTVQPSDGHVACILPTGCGWNGWMS